MDDSPVRLVTCRMRRWPLAELYRFANWIRREKFDVIHTHMSSAHMFGVIMKRMTGVPVVATAHSRHIQPHWRLNDHVIANSAATQRYQQRVNLVQSRRISTIHCFVDTCKFCEPDPVIYRGLRRQWHFQPDTRVMVIAGDVVPHKGHLFLFQCLPRLMRRYDDLRLVVVGRFQRRESYTRKLRNFLLQEGILKRVKWIGRRDNMHEILGAADLVIVPSIVESLGMIALESMAVGTPVIASRTGGLIELIEHERNGLLVPAKNSQAIGESVVRILDDLAFTRKLIAGGKQLVDQRFSPAVLARQVEDVLQQVAVDKTTPSKATPDCDHQHQARRSA